MKSFANKIDKFALLLILLYVLSLGMSFKFNILIDLLALEYPLRDMMTVQIKVYSLIFHVLSTAVYIGSGVWLYVQAKNENCNKWIWLFIGLFAGILGVIVWFLREILKETKEINKA